MSKPSSKDDYGPPLASTKAPSNVLQYGSLIEPSKASSSIVLKPSTPQKPKTTLAEKLISPPPIRNPLVSQNRFTPLQYVNRLVGPRDITSSSTSSLLITNPSTSKQILTEEYFEKPYPLDIMIIEKIWTQSPPRQIANALFPFDHHYLPNNFLKTRLFYEYILVDTESIEVTHTKDPHGKIQFSKIKILKILSPEDWGQALHQHTSFSRAHHPQEYSYYDYKDAWYNTLYVEPEKHSWFLWFRKGISLKFPKWFIKWFIDIGPSPMIFPQEIQNSYEMFKNHTAFVPGYKLISFIASQAITWIVAWDYKVVTALEGTDIKSLTRIIKVKWWKKFNNNLVCQQKIQEWLKNNSGFSNKNLLRQDALFLSEKQQLLSALSAVKSKEEFEKLLQKAASSVGSEKGSDKASEEEDSSSHYFNLEDMYEP